MSMTHNMNSGLGWCFTKRMHNIGISLLLCLTSILLTSCASIQTTPTCVGTDYVSGYGIVEIINHTERYHVGAYCKLEAPGVCEGEIIIFGIDTKYPPTRLRFAPGNYQLSLKILSGYEYVIKTYEFFVDVCDHGIVFEIK